MTTPEAESKPQTTFAEVILGPPHGLTFEFAAVNNAGGMTLLLNQQPLPEVEMQCPMCSGSAMRFKGKWLSVEADQDEIWLTVRPAFFICKNCSAHRVVMTFKFELFKPHAPTLPGTIFALPMTVAKIRVRKIGQDPGYTVPIPKKVQRFINGGDTWDLYLKGRRAEAQGLGIAAFIYYRRVVENLWSRLLERMINVAEEERDAEAITQLKEAQTNKRFYEAVKSISVPQKLMIDSENPLTLLHDAFSDGVHNFSDEETLGYAQAGRDILETLLQTMADVLESKKHMQEAVKTLKRKRPNAGGT